LMVTVPFALSIDATDEKTHCLLVNAGWKTEPVVPNEFTSSTRTSDIAGRRRAKEP